MRDCIGEVKDLVDIHKGRDFLILGAGSTIKHYLPHIEKFIKRKNLVTFGVNNVVVKIKPEYHIWTNNERLSTFGGNISPESKLILGCKLKQSVKDLYNYDYYNLNYDDKFNMIKSDEKNNIGYSNNFVSGRFRTAGNMAIFLAHIMGANNIYIAGMDGYMLKYKGDQHCYGKGNTDSSDDKYEQEKDDLIYNILRDLKGVGCNQKIVTPTIYINFYDGSVLN
jgi:hypothetical protein